MFNRIFKLIQSDETKVSLLPDKQLRRIGLIYNIYRFIISLFLFLSNYATVSNRTNLILVLPSFLHQTILIFYSAFSLFLLALFYLIDRYPKRQLGLGLAFDVTIISLLYYLSGTPDIQLIMLYVVVVAASFIMLAPYQALIITLMAIIFVIYQQFIYAITSSKALADLGNAVMLSLSFLGVGFLSWYVAQRLAKVEKIAARQTEEVAKLNMINQQVISTISHGVMVVSNDLRLRLTNLATINLLDLQLPSHTLTNINHNQDDAQTVMQQLAIQHPELNNWLTEVTRDTPSLFYYESPQTDSMVGKLRVNSTPLERESLLIVIEDVRREQSSAQQLKLASLGQLTASIAHEIRNPLATISQASQLLIEDIEFCDSQTANSTLQSHKNTLDESNFELYQMIYNQTKRVNRIIEDVLNLSRQTKSKFVIFSLVEWVKGFINEHFSSHDIFLHADCSPTVQFDVHQLEQILINLINNGLRYSSMAQPHAYVEIEINCRTNDVILDVLDTGSGVKAKDQNNLFNPFFTTNSDGTGLGLYLSQAFSEANNSRLIFVPEHDKTCFRLIIPLIHQLEST